MAPKAKRFATIPMPLDLNYLIPALSQNRFASVNANPLNQNGIRVASIFAGCGGLDLGFRWAGYRLAYSNEIDREAAKTYEDNLGHAPECKDINDVDVAAIPDHDILVAGFPCQPFSTSGKRKGFDDTRGTLFFNLASILQSKVPPVFLFENVPGLTNHDGGHTFRRIREVIHSCGYQMHHNVLNAVNFGVPQLRERIFMVGIHKSIDKSYKFPLIQTPHRSVAEAIDDLRHMPDLPNHEPMKHTKRIIERYSYIPVGGSLKDVPPQQRQRKRGDPNTTSGKISTQSYRRLVPNSPSPTITAMFQAHFIHYSEPRNLTAREAARLQSFPDDFIFHGKRVTMSWDKSLSQYAQIGNAVPPVLAFYLAWSIRDQLFGAEDKPIIEQ